MRKVLLLVPSLGIGGQERIAINTAQFLKEKYDVAIAYFQEKETEYIAPCRVFCFNLPAQNHLVSKIVSQIRRSLKLIKLCKKEKIEYVYSFGSTANLTNILTKGLTRAKSVIAIHGFADVKNNMILGYVYSHANKTICISKEMKYELLKIYPKLKNVDVIENGYDTTLFPAVVISRNSIERPKLISMGRLVEVKGFDRLLSAFVLIRKAIPGATLDIMGQGELEKELRAIVERNGLTECVSFLGYKENPLEELVKHDIYVLSSRNEGFPNALIEALGCQLAVISVDCKSGPREILTEKYDPNPVRGIRFEKYGVLVEDGSNEMVSSYLAEAVVALTKNKQLLRNYQITGYERSREFSMQRYGERIDEMFDKL